MLMLVDMAEVDGGGVEDVDGARLAKAAIVMG